MRPRQRSNLPALQREPLVRQNRQQRPHGTRRGSRQDGGRPNSPLCGTRQVLWTQKSMDPRSTTTPAQPATHSQTTKNGNANNKHTDLHLASYDGQRTPVRGLPIKAHRPLPGPATTTAKHWDSQPADGGITDTSPLARRTTGAHSGRETRRPLRMYPPRKRQHTAYTAPPRARRSRPVRGPSQPVRGREGGQTAPQGQK